MKLLTVDLELVLGIINGVSMITASTVSFYLAARTSVRTIRILGLLLAAFAAAHGSYHLLYSLVIGYPARELLDATSVVVLIIFALYYGKTGGLS